MLVLSRSMSNTLNMVSVQLANHQTLQNKQSLLNARRQQVSNIIELERNNVK